jgi:hypothetical protein
MNIVRGEALIGGAAILEFSLWPTRLSVISKRCHYVEQLFESDESATVCDFVIIDCVGQLCNFRTS